MDYLDLGSITDIEISYERLSNCLIVFHFRGQLDTYNTNIVSKSFFSFIQKNGEGLKNIVLDLEQVHYISSTGVGLIVEMFKTSKDIGAQLYLMNIIDNVLDVLKLLGFSTLFNIITDISEVEENKPQVFPKIVKCPSCGSKYKVIKSGAFKCSSCKHIFRINSKGEIIEG